MICRHDKQLSACTVAAKSGGPYPITSASAKTSAVNASSMAPIFQASTARTPNGLLRVTRGSSYRQSQAINSTAMSAEDAEHFSAISSALQGLARDWDGRVELRLMGPLAPYDFVGAPAPGE